MAQWIRNLVECESMLKIYCFLLYEIWFARFAGIALVSGARGSTLVKHSRVQPWTIIAHFPFVSDYQRNENTCIENTQSVPSAHTIKSKFLLDFGDIGVRVLCHLFSCEIYTLRSSLFLWVVLNGCKKIERRRAFHVNS